MLAIYKPINIILNYCTVWHWNQECLSNVGNKIMLDWSVCSPLYLALGQSSRQTASFDEGLSADSGVKGWGRRCQEIFFWGGQTTDVCNGSPTAAQRTTLILDKLGRLTDHKIVLQNKTSLKHTANLYAWFRNTFIKNTFIKRSTVSLNEM